MVQPVLKLKEFCFSNVILFTYQCITATWIILFLLLDINLSCTDVFINTCILLLSISIKILKKNRLFFTNSIALLCVLSTPECVEKTGMFLSMVFVNTRHEFVHIFGKWCPSACALTFIFPSLFDFRFKLTEAGWFNRFWRSNETTAMAWYHHFPPLNHCRIDSSPLRARNVPAVSLTSGSKP